jgi:hypothetical protein
MEWGTEDMMLRRGVAMCVAAVFLSGCASERTGFDYAGVVQKLGPPRPGQSRIVVLREKAFGGIGDVGWDIQLDGGPMSSLKTGTYVYADRPAGRHQLTATEALFPGVTQRDITAESGRTYFFVARTSERRNALMATSATGGLLGLAVGSAITAGYSNPGPLDFLPLDDSTVKTTIAELRLAE